MEQLVNWICTPDTPYTTIGYAFSNVSLRYRFQSICLKFDMTSISIYPSLNNKKAFDFKEREVGVSDSGVCPLQRYKIPQIYGQ